jgi:hypothetical protein
MAPNGELLIYAEYLANIRQISVVVSLPTSPDASTKAEIVQDGRQLQVVHQQNMQSIALPAQVVAPPLLPIPKQGGKDLSWRLPVSPLEPRPSPFSLENQALPWTSIDIKVGSPISCRKCDDVLVSKGTINAWKDLPSENWAEMMEFWHCHKPHDHDQQDPESLASKGYGANNTISAQPGVGFVDLTSFLFTESDCSGLAVSPLGIATILLLFIFPFRPFSTPSYTTGRKKVTMLVPKPLSDVATDTTPRERCFGRSHSWAGKSIEPFRENGFCALT